MWFQVVRWRLAIFNAVYGSVDPTKTEKKTVVLFNQCSCVWTGCECLGDNMKQWVNWGLIVSVTLCLVAASLLNWSAPGNIPGQTDKLNHVIGFTCLAVVTHLSASIRFSRMKILIYLLMVGVVIELLQSGIPGRRASFLDFAADIAGILLGLSLGMLIQRELRN